MNVVKVRGARVHNLRSVDVDIPRDAMVVFTGLSGSGKSSLAFGTLYAEAQRRYFESVSPYARRLIDQVAIPDVDVIEGLPPAVALQQQRGASSPRSSVGSVSTISNLLRMLYSRAGDYPKLARLLHAQDFSPNTPQGACPQCHGLGRLYDVTPEAMVPDPSLSIRDRAIAAWPPAWHGQNLRDILVTLGIDVDLPWRRLPKKERDWILFTEDQPTVPVYAGYTPAETRRALKRKEEPSYQGTFTGVRKYVLHTFRTTQSPHMKRRVSRFLSVAPCPLCHGKRLTAAALAVKFGGLDIAAMSHAPLKEMRRLLLRTVQEGADWSEERRLTAQRLVADVGKRVATLARLGLDYLSLERGTPTLSPGELQRLRLAAQIQSNLFGVVYVLDEPSAGLHPADTQSLLEALQGLKSAGNSLFVIEHDLDIIRHADWIVDVGPGAGVRGGRIVYSGPLEGLRAVQESHTRQFLFSAPAARAAATRAPSEWLTLRGVTRNNLRNLDVRIPLGVFTVITGISGAGKSSLVSAAIPELLADRLSGEKQPAGGDLVEEPAMVSAESTRGRVEGGGAVRRVVAIDQKPIGRTPRSNLATYLGFFDEVRKLFAGTALAKSRRYSASRFSFNVAQGRCEACQGEGFLMVELLFMPSVYAPCPRCAGKRYNDKTLEVLYEGKNVAEVLDMNVDEACRFFSGHAALVRSLKVLQALGLGYLRLGQSATELSGGEAQRVKLATELQYIPRGSTLYAIDEPTNGLHPADVERFLAQLSQLLEAGNTVIVAEHDMRIAAAADWIIDLGPGAGDEGGQIVAEGAPAAIADCAQSKTSAFLRAALEGSSRPQRA